MKVNYLLRFESIDLLVRDGLISMYIERHASEYIKTMAEEAIYEQSPYSQYYKSAEQTLRKRETAPSKAHNFSQFTFKMPHYCDYCRNFLWGLVQQVREKHIQIFKYTFTGRKMFGLWIFSA